MSSTDATADPLGLARQYFREADDRFVPALRQVHNPKALAEIANEWKADVRPWAREQQLAYLELPLDSIGHQVIVKRLFKQAEAAGDHELMAAFMTAFDRLIRRAPRTRRSRPPVLPAEEFRTYTDWRGREYQWKLPVGPGARLFSVHTRYYLRRRAWRYFRYLAHRQPELYVPAVAAGLARYDEADVSQAADVLESWGLCHALFGRWRELKFGASRIRPAGQLQPPWPAEPEFPQLWADPAAVDALWKLTLEARSSVVRSWAVQALRRWHDELLRYTPLSTILLCLRHADDQVQLLAVAIIETSALADEWSPADWLSLLDVESPLVQAAVCVVLERSLLPERLSLEQCLGLACARGAPAARVGLRFLQQRDWSEASQRRELARLARAACPAVAGELAVWALPHLTDAEVYDVDVVIEFFDSLLSTMRTASCQWLERAQASGHRARNDAVLWQRLFESPHDDVRLRLVELLERRLRPHRGTGGRTKSDDGISDGAVATAGEGGISTAVEMVNDGAGVESMVDVEQTISENLALLWSSVLLNVERGNRQKQRVLQQIGQALQEHPQRASQLLPILATAIRSSRRPERQTALAALIQAVHVRPELEGAANACLPELKLAPLA